MQAYRREILERPKAEEELTACYDKDTCNHRPGEVSPRILRLLHEGAGKFCTYDEPYAEGHETHGIGKSDRWGYIMDARVSGPQASYEAEKQQGKDHDPRERHLEPGKHIDPEHVQDRQRDENKDGQDCGADSRKTALFRTIPL